MASEDFKDLGRIGIYTTFIETKKVFIVFQGRNGNQIQILRADCFLQLFPGFYFGFDVKTLRCQLTCLNMFKHEQ